MSRAWLMNPLTHFLAPAPVPEPVAFGVARKIAPCMRESWQNCSGRTRTDTGLLRNAVLSRSKQEDGNTVPTKCSVPCGDIWDSEHSGARRGSRLQHRIDAHISGNETEQSLRYCEAFPRRLVSSKSADVSIRIADRKQ